MPYVLAYAPATFQGAMHIVLSPLLRKGVLVFMDDILVHTQELEEHRRLLTQVLQLLQQNGLKEKMSKCTFAQNRISYLGHIISEQGVATDDSKVHAVQEWPEPTNAKQLRAFLGLAGYYRKFVRFFGVISKPLANLLVTPPFIIVH
jgi:hypothetical protein